MSLQQVDGTPSDRIAEIGRKTLGGNPITRDDAAWLFSLERTADILDLLAWANRIREKHKGNRVHLCSIVNIKSGGCPEDCKFCAQSALYDTSAARYGLIDRGSILKAAEEAGRNGVRGLGLVAAWKGLEEGPLLDELCQHLRALKETGRVRPDGSLGMIRNQGVADRLKEAGLECYNHNLETSRRFFSSICTTHAYDDRVRTLRHLKAAGIKICSGGILGMGETREDRCEMAFALKELDVDFVPLNFLNPIQGTPLGCREKLAPMEALKSIACFRFVLPRQEIMIAGGREAALRDLQSMMFLAGASALMVGNYLTTLNRPVEDDLQMIQDLGMEVLRGEPASLQD